MKVSSLVDASNNLGRHLVLVPPGTIRCSSGTKANQQPFGPNTRRRSVRMVPHGVSQYFCWESGVSIRGCGWFQDSAIDHHDDHTYLLGYANSPKNNLGQLCCLGVVDEQNRLGFYNILLLPCIGHGWFCCYCSSCRCRSGEGKPLFRLCLLVVGEVVCVWNSSVVQMVIGGASKDVDQTE